MGNRYFWCPVCDIQFPENDCQKILTRCPICKRVGKKALVVYPHLLERFEKMIKDRRKR